MGEDRAIRRSGRGTVACSLAAAAAGVLARLAAAVSAAASAGSAALLSAVAAAVVRLYPGGGCASTEIREKNDSDEPPQ